MVIKMPYQMATIHLVSFTKYVVFYSWLLSKHIKN